MKRAKGTIDGMNPKAWMDYMLDHTTIVAEDDPYLESFKLMEENKLIQLRIIPATGAERFAEYFYNKLNNFVQAETEGRVRVVQVEFREHEKNRVPLTQPLMWVWNTSATTAPVVVAKMQRQRFQPLR